MPILGVALLACQPAKEEDSLLFQIQEIETQEARALFVKAKDAAEKDDINTAESLVEQALGRGAGTAGLEDAQIAILDSKKRTAERIAKQKRLEEERREAVRRESQSSNVSSSSSRPSSNLRPSGLKRIDGVTTGTGSLDSYNAYCMDGSYTSVTVNYNVSSDPIICASNSFRPALCKRRSEWSMNDAGQYGCKR